MEQRTRWTHSEKRLDFIKSVPKFKKSMQSDKTWGPKNVDKRGLEGNDAQDRVNVKTPFY